MMLIMLFSVHWRFFPPSGAVLFYKEPLEALRYLVLPVSALAFVHLASITRQMRSSMLEVLAQDYITTARSKGLHERIVINRHALRNALLPIATIAGMQMGRLIGGAVILETMFAIPGLGSTLVNAVFGRDLLIVQTIVLMVATSILIMNLITDIIYGYLDPRITYS